MAQRWHWLKLRTTCHPTEVSDRVRQALLECSGLDSDGLAAVLEETELDSHHGGKVVVLEATIKRAAEIRKCLGLIWSEAAVDRLSQEVDPRTDEGGVFHFRMAKQAAYAGNLRTTGGDDAIQVRLKPEVHPASREGAILAVKSALDGAKSRFAVES